MDGIIIFMNIGLLALMLGLVGPLLIWQRVSFIGDTMAHSSILGIAIALVFSVQPPWGIFATCFVVGGIVYWIKDQFPQYIDGGLNIISCSFLGIGMLIAEKSLNRHEDLENYLFGDVWGLAVSDALLIGAVVVAFLIFLKFCFRDILLLSMDRDLAQSQRINVRQLDFFQMVLFSGVVAVSLKTVGVLIMPAAMIIPALGARLFSNSPRSMMMLSVAISLVVLGSGVWLSKGCRFPTGPSIVVVGAILFLVLLALKGLSDRRKQGQIVQ